METTTTTPMDIKAGLRIKACPYYSMPTSRSSAKAVRMPHAVPATVVGPWNEDTTGKYWIVRFDTDLFLSETDTNGPGPWQTDQLIYANEIEPLGSWYA